MPIRPENRDRYGPDWADFSARIRFQRAGGRCECRGECRRPARHLAADGRCRNHHGQPAWGTGKPVVLTVAHRNHVPEQRGDDQVAAMCQGCHLHYDIDHHRQTRERARTAELAAQHDPLFDVDTAVHSNEQAPGLPDSGSPWGSDRPIPTGDTH